MEFNIAVEIVLDLAWQNIIDPKDNEEEAKRQREAYDKVYEFLMKNMD